MKLTLKRRLKAMRKFKLSKRSIARLGHVHPLLSAVPVLAITLTEVDFGITEGLRTQTRQAELMKIGATKTMNSLHLRQSTGFAHAFDAVAYVKGRVTWEPEAYVFVGKAMKQAAAELGVEMEWGALKKYGGNWSTFNDMPHFQLPRSFA